MAKKRPTRRGTDKAPARVVGAIAPDIDGSLVMEGDNPEPGLVGLHGKVIRALSDGRLPKEWKRGVANHYGDLYRRCYEATGHPLFAWAAFETYRHAGDAPPEWVLTYLDGMTQRLRGLRWDDRPSTPGATKQKLAHAFGHKRPGAFFSDFETMMKDIQRARVVERLNAKGFTKVEARKQALADLAKTELRLHLVGRDGTVRQVSPDFDEIHGAHTPPTLLARVKGLESSEPTARKAHARFRAVIANETPRERRRRVAREFVAK